MAATYSLTEDLALLSIHPTSSPMDIPTGSSEGSSEGLPTGLPEDTPANTPTTSTKELPKKKPRKTLYWGIHFNVETILNHPLVKQSMDENPQLKPNKQMHTTLLYVGRKDDDREKAFDQFKGKSCAVTVSGHGISTNALALKVTQLVFVDDDIKSEPVPTFATMQHVTVGLKEGVKAVDSIKSFEEGTCIDYGEDFVLTGKLTQYFF